MTKCTKRSIFCIVLTLFIFLNSLPTLSLAQSSEGIMVNEGDYLVYQPSSTATYRMYDDRFRLNVTDNSSFPILGTFDTVKQENDEWVPINDSNTVTNVKLLPYIINASNIEESADKCPLEGLNDSRSYLIENWNEDNLKFNQKGEAFADRAEEYFIFTYEYTYEEPNRKPGSTDIDIIKANVTYWWDEEFGVLLKQSIRIDNLNDSSMDGTINCTLIDTSLWSLDTGGGIPGYPIWIVSTSTIVAILFIMNTIVKRSKHTKRYSKEVGF